MPVAISNRCQTFRHCFQLVDKLLSTNNGHGGGMFTGGAIVVIGIALDPDWAVVSAFDCAIMLKAVSTTYYAKVNIHCGEIKDAT